MSNPKAVKDQMMTTQTATPLPLRNDTILGVCEALGRDFGFNPLWLRLALIAPLFYSPMLSIGGYFGLAVIVGLTNWFAPDKTAAQPQLVSSHDIKRADAEIDEAMPIAA